MDLNMFKNNPKFYKICTNFYEIALKKCEILDILAELKPE
jgi:hypothetical protein